MDNSDASNDSKVKEEEVDEEEIAGKEVMRPKKRKTMEEKARINAREAASHHTNSKLIQKECKTEDAKEKDDERKAHHVKQTDVKHTPEKKESSIDTGFFKCDKCDKEFVTVDFLNKHKFSHSTVPLHCSYCGQVFKEIGLLKKHLDDKECDSDKDSDDTSMEKIPAQNTRERVLVDENSDSDSDDALKIQTIIDQKEKELNELKKKKQQIQESDKSAEKNIVKKAPLKRFQCLECNKCFRKKCDLQRHKRTHTGERPYSCDKCKRKFTRFDNLQRHIQAVHKGPADKKKAKKAKK